MKTCLNFLIVSFLFGGLICCTKVEEPDHEITIAGIPSDTTLVENNTLKLTITVKAKDGLTNFKIDNSDFPVSGLQTFTTSFEIVASLDDPSESNSLIEKKFYVRFYARDKSGTVLQKQFLVTVIPDSKLAGENSESPDPHDPIIYKVDSDITTDQVWDTGNIYILDGRITVLPGVKLTIQKGVIVKGTPNLKEISTLVISRGAQIDAQGTDGEPIIFTSILDSIVPGTIEPKLSGSFFDGIWWNETGNLDFENKNGLWGGLVILGKARVSFPGDVQEFQLPGIPSSEENANYGGLDNQDNSGILKNISIRFAGNKWDSNQKISALTLAGVGTVTKIENIEIYSSATDGISIYGGSVGMANILVKNSSNYGFQIDQGWSGTLDNFVVINSGNASFDIHGPKGNYTNGIHFLANGLISSQHSKGLISFHDNSNTDLSKVLIHNITELEYGFSMTANNDLYQPKVDQFEVLDGIVSGPMGDITYTGDKFQELFKGWDENQIKLVKWNENSVGPNLEGFKNWSWVYTYHLRFGIPFPGI